MVTRRSFIALFLLFSLGSAVCAGDVFVYDSHGKRDPFVPLVGVTAQTIESLEDIMCIEDVSLQGIAHDSGGKRVAIINGELIKEGQTVGRITMKKILKDEITVIINGDEYKLNIYGEEGG